MNASVHNDLGNLLKATLNLPAAKLCYSEAIRLEPSLAVAWNNLACVYLDEGSVPLALQHYIQAILLDPGLECAYVNMVWCMSSCCRLPYPSRPKYWG
jgi:protein O-GlcNAc transferase